jgi:hypothetical protein
VPSITIAGIVGTKPRGRPIARVAAARKVLTLVYYGLRDGHIRCLAEQPAEAA